MIARFIAWLTDKDYEPCKSCKLVKEMIEYERAENKELRDLISSLLKPQVVYQTDAPAPQPIAPKHQMWARRRAEIEKADAEVARKIRDSNLNAKPDVVQTSPIIEDQAKQLEMELGIIPTEDLQTH